MIVQAVSTRTDVRRPQPLSPQLCLFVCCLLFVGMISCSSAGSTRNAPPALTASPPVTLPARAAGGPHLTYTGHRGAAVLSVAWSPDGTRIASTGNDKTVQVWDPLTGRTLLTYTGHAEAVEGVAWSPDGARIASGGFDQTVQVWDARTGQRLLTYHGHANTVFGMAWSPDGTRIASGSDDHTVQVWDPTTGHTLVTYRGHSSGVRRVAWSPHGKFIASASQDGTVQVWDAATGQQLLTYGDQMAPIWTMAWSPDGTRIASAPGNDQYDNGKETVQVWNARTGGTLVAYHGHGPHSPSSQELADGVLGIAWSPDGARIASGGADETVQVWEAATGHMLMTDKSHTEVVWDVAWSPDGTRIASAGGDGMVMVWQLLRWTWSCLPTSRVIARGKPF